MTEVHSMEETLKIELQEEGKLDRKGNGPASKPIGDKLSIDTEGPEGCPVRGKVRFWREALLEAEESYLYTNEMGTQKPVVGDIVVESTSGVLLRNF